ncbi:MAG TPA: SCO family protein [Bacilli bacterium]
MGKLLPLVIVLLFGSTLLWFGTDGFRAFTSEGARRVDIVSNPRQVPDIQLEDQNGQTFSMADLAGKTVLMTFFYARCTDVCPELQDHLHKVAEMLPPGRLGKDIVLLSVSFDPNYDDEQVLHEYALRFEAQAPTWRIARVADKEQLKQLLNRFGVVVIPVENGEFEHNDAIYIVNKEQKLTHIFDYTADRSIAEAALAS